MADLWSDYTDALIKEIDKSLGSKYKMSIEDLLTNVNKYTATPNMAITISNMKEDINKYIDGLLGDMPDDVRALENDMSKANAVTGQLSQNISMQTKQNNIPLLKPYDVIRDASVEETVQVDFIDDQVLKLAAKLVESSNLVADFGYAYKNYNVGLWLFDRNEKNYMIEVYVPPNDALDLENGRDELNGLLDAATGFIRG